MSQRSDSRPFDIVVIVLFVLIVGWFALHSNSPEQSSIPGVSWPSAPQPELVDDAKTSAVTLESPPADSTVPVQTEAAPEAPASEGSWE